MTEKSDLVKLKKLYYSPESGFSSLNKLIKKVREQKLDLTIAEIKAFYEAQKVNQVFSDKKLDRNDYVKITVPDYGYLVADLLDVSNWSHKNHGVRYLLNIIDTFSRHVWSFPIRTKSPEDTSKGLEVVLKEIKAKKPERITMTTDDGTEWKGKFGKILKEFRWNIPKALGELNEIEHFIANPNTNTKRRTAHIESFNRTLLNLIKKYQLATDSTAYVDKLDDLIKNYNDTYHRGIKAKPNEVWANKKKTNEKPKEFVDKLKIGDYVRVLMSADVFKKKGRELRYSDKVYRIIERDGMRYKLSEPETFKILKESYLPRQLLKVVGDVEEPSMQEYMQEIKVSKAKKKFVRKQRESGLDVNKEGEIIKYPQQQPRRSKREVKMPMRMDTVYYV